MLLFYMELCMVSAASEGNLRVQKCKIVIFLNFNYRGEYLSKLHRKKCVRKPRCHIFRKKDVNFTKIHIFEFMIHFVLCAVHKPPKPTDFCLKSPFRAFGEVNIIIFTSRPYLLISYAGPRENIIS